MKRFSALTILVLWSSFAVRALAQNAEELARTLRAKPSVPVRSSLAQFAKAHPKDQAGAVASLALAFHDIEAKMPERAIPALRDLSKRLPKIADYVALFQAQAEFDAGEYREAARTAATVVNSSIETRAVAMAVKALLKLERAADAVTLVRSRYSRLEQPAADLALAQALEASRDTAAAATLYRGIYSRYPRSAEAPEAGQGMERLQAALDARERFERANKLLDANDAQAARIDFQAAAAALSGIDAELAKVRVGAAHYKARESSTALRLLRDLNVTSPEADAERLHWAVLAARRAREYAVMQSIAADLVSRYKDSRWRVAALVEAGNQEMLNETDGEPLKWFRACADSTSDSALVSYCAWRVAFQSYLERKPHAYDELFRFVERYPAAVSTSAALYYLGRLAESGKDATTAKSFFLRVTESFPNHFYAVLSRDRLASPALRNVTAQPAFAGIFFSPPPLAPFEPAGEAKLRIERAMLLAGAGLDDYAERELRSHTRSGGPAHLVAQALAQFASRRGEHDRAVRFIKGIFPGYLTLPIEKAPASFWRLAYPLPYREDLERFARSNDLDPFLVAGLIRQESEFKATAVSRAKALGLMQVMPPTGREIARKVGVKNFRTNMLLDPKISLQFGTYHLKKWLDAEGGRVEVTLAAYNAGKTRADRWIKRYDFREPAEFIETIPFLETRDYVQSVLRNADFYRRLYGTSASRLRSEDAGSRSTEQGTGVGKGAGDR